MKRSYIGVILLCILLFLNIVFTQKAVNAYYFDHFTSVIVYAALNILLFPVAIWIYRRERDVE
ncbi:hypothetical protein PAECIP111891_02073 [Paenibacillus allorhizoplanae]|uniref:Uncharacterized protein n=1 Tax=Paenibacillus allorhizoplanae TaxID=2905648 RepID=A0ABN8GEH5_9BACL|nr:hypothetical protein [Paenibacillus allorhizoplanae]CAH1202233.1 hypothetical protein PAECIP111891_02073 [Paenibacillus allorhizoplanae]